MSSPTSSGPYDHVNEKFRHVMQLTDAQRLAFIEEDRWVGYGRAKEVLDVFTGVLNAPSRIRPKNYLLIGEPNNGKTTLMYRFAQQCGEPFIDEEREAVKPVIIAQAPPTPDEKGLYATILDQFWTAYRATSPAITLRNQVVQQLRDCKVRMIFIDEFHSLLGGTRKKQGEVMNAIKYLSNVCGVPIIGIGTANAVQVLYTDPQHTSRFEVLSLPLWDADEKFQTLLAGFESVLPLRKASHLSTVRLASLLHTNSGGVLGDLQFLLQELAKNAIKTGIEQITEDAIRARGMYRTAKLRGKAA